MFNKLKVIFSLLTIGTAIGTFAENPFLKFGTSEKPVKIINLGKKVFIVTEHHIYESQKDRLISRYQSDVKINDALIDTSLWLGTEKGLVELSSSSFQQKTNANIKVLKGNITALCKDSLQQLWVAAQWEGTFVLKKDSLFKKMEVVPNLSMSANNEPYVWIGSSVGLYKLSITDDQWLRYAEEGYSGYELPDNIIEQLYSFKNSGTWVIMADHIGFIPNHHVEGHVPAFNFIGTADNVIHDIAAYAHHSFLFATTTGLIFLPTEPEDPHHHDGGYTEVHATPKSLPVGIEVDMDKLQLNASFKKNEIQSLWVDAQNNLWVANVEGIQKVRHKLMKKALDTKHEQQVHTQHVH